MPVTTMTEFRTLEKSEWLPDNYVNPYYLEDLKRRVSIARVGGKLYAFGDMCPFDGAPLSAGLLTGNTLMCQCDGSQFDVTTGQVLRGPATRPLEMHEVREAKGEMQVRM